MCCDCEVMEFDGAAMSFMTGPYNSNLNVYEHKFMKTIEATKRGPHQGHTRNTLPYL